MIENKILLDKKLNQKKNPNVKEVPKETPKKEQPKPDEDGKPKKSPLLDSNILGSEFYNLIRNRFDYKIKIKNVRVFYEDSNNFGRERPTDANDTFTFELVLNDIVLNSEDIKDYKCNDF